MTMIILNKKIQNSGFTLIEAMVFLFIFSIITMTFYSVITLGTNYIIESKNRLGALALANEKMEIVRNLKYDDIGLTTGIPSGSMLEDEDAIAGSNTYHVKTIAQYVDDPFDGVFPADSAPNDYKKVKVTISWGGANGSTGSMYLVSRFVPPGMEVAAGDGILSINIIDSTGSGIPQAQVHITNNNVSPAVNITQNTDDSGNLIFPGAAESILGYQISTSKNNYETVSTVNPEEMAYVPVDTHASVVKGFINTKSIVIDRLSDLKIKTTDSLGNPIPDVNFKIKGGRILGTDTGVVPNETIYKLDSSEKTQSDGEMDFNELSPGQIFLSDISDVSGYSLVGISSLSGFDPTLNIYRSSLISDEEKTIEIKFADESLDSLLVKVLSNADDSPIYNAQVRLTNGSGYDTTVSTSFDGKAFFPINSDPLLPGTYTVEIIASGFQNYSSEVDIDNLTTEEAKLIPN